MAVRNIGKLIEKNKDLTKAKLSTIEQCRFKDCDLSDVVFPGDREFFQHCNGKFIENCTLPKIDLNSYNFDGIFLNGVTFDAETILPKDADFFQRLECKCINKCVMPAGDYSVYNFDGVDVEFTVFTHDSKLPTNLDLFIKLRKKSIVGTVLPFGDYSKYDFTNVNIFGAQFTEDSYLSDDSEFFQKCKIHFLETVRLPFHVKQTLFNYNLDGICHNLTKMGLDENVMVVLDAKNKNKNDISRITQKTLDDNLFCREFNQPEYEEIEKALDDAYKQFDSSRSSIELVVDFEFDKPTKIVTGKGFNDHIFVEKHTAKVFYSWKIKSYCYMYNHKYGRSLHNLHHESIIRITIKNPYIGSIDTEKIMDILRKTHPNVDFKNSLNMTEWNPSKVDRIILNDKWNCVEPRYRIYFEDQLNHCNLRYNGFYDEKINTKDMTAQRLFMKYVDRDEKTLECKLELHDSRSSDNSKIKYYRVISCQHAVLYLY